MKNMMKNVLKKAVFLIPAAVFVIFFLFAVIGAATDQMAMILTGGEEEEEKTNGQEVVYVSNLLINQKVEGFRDAVLAEAKKYGTEDYVDLFLAVMMQESRGDGNDVFQCSESVGKPLNSLTVKESVEQGVKYLSAALKNARVKSPQDLDGIRLALQGYNFGNGYIDWAVQRDGGWTQENTFEFAKIHSKGVQNTGARIEQLGPWHYGDQYYTAHVLRYYSTGQNSKAGEAVKIEVDKRLDWLFEDGVPTSETQMKQYLTQIQVPIINAAGKEDTMVLMVHKKLAGEIQAVFKDMKKAGFKVLPEATAGYSWRKMASNSSAQSHHSYGCVVDLNWTHNGASYTGWPYNPGKDEYAVTAQIVAIWKKHGFYWGGDWSGSYFDPMHFTYTNH